MLSPTAEHIPVLTVEIPVSYCPACRGNHVEVFLRAPDRFHGRQKDYELARCPYCSLVWLNNPPSPAEMGEHYGPDYDRSVAAAGVSPDRWKGRVETISRLKSGGALLDLGCSSGNFLRSMKSPTWKLSGIEMSNEVAQRAEAASGAHIFVGDILDAPFAPESFDVVTCFHVFEHLYQPLEVLERVTRWLKPGGIFYLMVPNIDSAGAKIFGRYWYALELPRHLFHFSPKSLATMANSVGLEKTSLITAREVFIEDSIRYMIDDAMRRFGRPRLPLAKATTPSIPFRVVRKAFRLTLLPVLDAGAGLVGDGESIHGIFRKPERGK